MYKKRHNDFAFDTETIKGKAFMYSIYSEHEATVRYINNQMDVIQFYKYCIDTYKEGFAWNLAYDVLAFLKWLPETLVTDLYFNKTIDVCGIHIKYIEGKRFEMFYYDSRGKQHKTVLYDIANFYNRIKLDTAAKKFLNVPGKIDIKEKGIDVGHLEKHLRSITDMEIVKEYCLYDSELTYKLVHTFKEAADECDLKITNYTSVGAVAWAYMNKFVKVPVCNNPEIQDFVRRGYFGGRIEFQKRGKFKRVYMADICSAYPHAMRLLKKIIDTKFKNEIDKEAEYFFVECSFELPEKYISPVTFRLHGLITYPTGKFNNIVLDNYTYDIVKQYTDIKIHRVLNVYTSNEYLFKDFIEETYKKRFKSESHKMIFKMILNSLYGKLVEKSRVKFRGLKDYSYLNALNYLNDKHEKVDFENTLLKKCTCKCKKQGYISNYCKCPYCCAYKRTFWRKKNYDFIFGEDIDIWTKEKQYAAHTNIIYGALITAYTRNYIYDISQKIGEKNCVGFMTDCIISTKPVPRKYLTTKKELGKLEYKYDGPAYILGSGIYQYGDVNKFRGYDSPVKLNDIAKNNPKETKVAILSKIKKGISSMVIQGLTIDKINLIEGEEKYLNVNFDRKRLWDKDFKNFGHSAKTVIDSKPLKL